MPASFISAFVEIWTSEIIYENNDGEKTVITMRPLQLLHTSNIIKTSILDKNEMFLPPQSSGNSMSWAREERR